MQFSQKNFSFVPILLKELSYEECCEVAKVLAEFLNENICLLVSSDFTHYGASYGFLPDRKIGDIDREVIESIIQLNSKHVYELAGKSTICGYYGLTIISEIAKIKKMKAKPIGYYTSGDIVNNGGNCVGYGGAVFG